MRGMAKRAIVWTIATTLLLPTAATATEEPRETAIGAAGSFSIALGMWLLEERCKTLPAEKRSAFFVVIVSDERLLKEVVDKRLYDAAVGAGDDVAKDPKYADCKALAEGLADFGFKMAKKSAAKLASLPPGYHLTITD